MAGRLCQRAVQLGASAHRIERDAASARQSTAREAQYGGANTAVSVDRDRAIVNKATGYVERCARQRIEGGVVGQTVDGVGTAGVLNHATAARRKRAAGDRRAPG